MYRTIAKLIFTLLLVGVVTAAETKTTWDGWVSDTKCGTSVNPDCAKKCARAGIKPVFVNSDKTIFQVANPDSVKGHEGDHVTVKGTLDKGVLTVSSITAFDDKKASK